LEGISITGLAAEPAFGLVAAFRFEPPGDWYLWPDFRLGVAAATTSGTWRSEEGVGATWRWLYARSEACPLRLLESGRGRIHLGVCATLDLGVVASRGEALVNDQTEYRLWISPGAELRLEWWVADPMALAVASGAAFAPQPYKYVSKSGPQTDDSADVFTMPWFGPVFSVGAAFRLP
jgi:hypothetical protein